jgi:MFS family permease
MTSDTPAALGGVSDGVKYRWLILSSALLVQITISIVTQAFPALAPFAKTDLGLSTAEVGLFATILNLGTMLALMPAGWAVDVLGEKRVLLVGGVLTGLLATLAAFSPTFMVLLPALVLVGAAAATPTPAGSTAILSAFPLKDRGFVMSVRQTGIPIGGALAALILPPIAIATDWRVALIVAAGLAVLGAVVSRLLVLRTPRRRNATVRGDRGSLRSVATRDATLIGVAAIFLTLGQFVLASYIALYLLSAFHIPLSVGSLFLVAANLGGALGRMMWGRISDRLFDSRRKEPLMVACVTGAAGFLVLAWLPSATPELIILALVLFLGATVIGWNGLYITLLSEIAPPDKVGRSVGYGMMVSQVGIFGGPFAFGLFVDLSHSYRLAWTVVAGAMLVSVVLLRRVREPDQSAADRPAPAVTS